MVSLVNELIGKNWKLIVAIILISATIIILGNGTEKKVHSSVELSGINGYVNSNGITIGENVGKKVILIDFWTYSCINCLRTVPYLNNWYEKYKDDGLIIIGVHSPEFEFEKDYSNVKKQVEELGIKYPVVLDNGHKTWNNFQNSYWPREYLIGVDGTIIYDHIGEGNYAETEQRIQQALGELNNKKVEMPLAEPPEKKEVDFYNIGTPEIYFGYGFRRDYIGNAPAVLLPEQETDFNISGSFEQNKPYLEGKWKNNQDNFELASEEGKVVLLYKAKYANIVAQGDADIEIYLDNQSKGNVKTKDAKLYQVADSGDYGWHLLELKIKGKGFKIYTFTFG